MRASWNKGMSLGSVMLTVLVLTVLGFALAGLATTHLRLTVRSGADVRASNLARSTASLAIAKLLETPEFGTGEEKEVVLETEDGLGFLSFDPETTPTSDFAASTNNLEGTIPVPGGFGEPVPSGSVHLVARGESGGVTRTVEVVLRVPPFPWAVASAGTVEIRRGVLIGALPEGTWPPPPEDELLPADLLSNFGEGDAVLLGSDSTILGDVETPGTVRLTGSPDTISVEGEIRSGVRPVDLPTLRASDYDPAQDGRAFDNLNSFVDTGSRVRLTGAARREGDLTISSGLDLEGAHLFVDGDLTVRQSLTGSGIIVATGNVTIENGLTLDGATEVAVVADGRVHLSGRGRASSTIRGVFYAGRGLEAEEMTLAGTLLAGDATSGIELENVSVYAEEPQPITVSGAQALQFYLGLYDPNRPGSYRQQVGVVGNQGVPQGFRPLATVNAVPSAGGGFPIMITLNGPSGSLQLVAGSPQELDDLRPPIQAFLASNIPVGEDIDRLTPLLNDISTYDFRGQILGESSPGGGETSLELYGDISEFLPFEERVRVVSWLEH